jgi:hypothetical protein
MFGNFTLDTIAAIGFGIQLDAYGEQSNEFVESIQTLSLKTL